MLTAVIILNALHKKLNENVFFSFFFGNCFFNEAPSEGFNDEAGHCIIYIIIFTYACEYKSILYIIYILVHLCACLGFHCDEASCAGNTI